MLQSKHDLANWIDICFFGGFIIIWHFVLLFVLLLERKHDKKWVLMKSIFLAAQKREKLFSDIYRAVIKVA